MSLSERLRSILSRRKPPPPPVPAPKPVVKAVGILGGGLIAPRKR